MAKAEDLGILDVEAVLRDTFRLQGTIRRGRFVLLCPSHEDHKPSCDVQLSTGYWNCWSCPAGGDIIDLGVAVLDVGRKTVRKMLKVNDPDMRALAMKHRIGALRAAASPQTASRGGWAPSIPPPGSYASEPLDYMLNRGFTVETLQRWGVRYASRVVLQKVPENLAEDENAMFELMHVIAIPVFNETGNIVMWTYRSTDRSEKWQPKYVHTPGVDKQKFWFGINLCQDEDEVAVCEGPADAMWLDQCGIPAIANLGSHLKNVSANLAKIDRLCSFRKVTLFFDRDAGGIGSTLQIGSLLHDRGVDVRVARYLSCTAGASDPAELNALDAQIMYWRAASWLRFVHGATLRCRPA